MRRTIGWLVVLAVFLLAGFYVAWPSWTGYRIMNALEAKNPALLAQKIDFDSVRISLLPVVRARVDQEIDKKVADAGPLGQAIGPKLKSELAPKIADMALATLVTPENMIRIASEGGSIKDNVERILREQLPSVGAPGNIGPTATPIGGAKGLGGLLGEAAKQLGGGVAKSAEPASTSSPAPTAAKAPGKPSFSLANIKSFAMTSLASFAVGVVRDPAMKEVDLTAEMAFRGGDWKLVGLVPRL